MKHFTHAIRLLRTELTHIQTTIDFVKRNELIHSVEALELRFKEVRLELFEITKLQYVSKENTLK